MRAATAIVGAVAVASILIALAFILSGGGDSAATVRTTVTEEIVRAPETEREPATERSTAEGGSPGFGGPKECAGGDYTVEDVSCEIGAQIREGYEEGGRGELLAEDQEAGETITMSCAGTAPVECKGPGGAKVYFGE